MRAGNGFLVLLATLTMLVSASASADGKRHGHHGSPRVGVNIQWGSPYHHRHYYRPYHYGYGGWYGPYYGPSFYYYDVPVYRTYEVTRIVEPPAAPVVSGPPPVQNWYLCEDYDEYYPHVTDCPSAWTLVPATPQKR